MDANTFVEESQKEYIPISTDEPYPHPRCQFEGCNDLVGTWRQYYYSACDAHAAVIGVVDCDSANGGE